MLFRDIKNLDKLPDVGEKTEKPERQNSNSEILSRFEALLEPMALASKFA